MVGSFDRVGSWLEEDGDCDLYHQEIKELHKND